MNESMISNLVTGLKQDMNTLQSLYYTHANFASAHFRHGHGIYGWGTHALTTLACSKCANLWHLYIYYQVLRLICSELGGNGTHDHHNSGVTALHVELPSPWEQGDGELGTCIQVLLHGVWLGSPKGISGMTCYYLWLSVRCFNCLYT